MHMVGQEKSEIDCPEYKREYPQAGSLCYFKSFSSGFHPLLDSRLRGNDEEKTPHLRAVLVKRSERRTRGRVRYTKMTAGGGGPTPEGDPVGRPYKAWPAGAAGHAKLWTTGFTYINCR
jgi:hypothetical protein